MARAGARLGVRALAAEARVSPNTITRVEADNASNASTLAAIKRALEAHGAEFLAGNAVRLGSAVLEPPSKGGSTPSGPSKPKIGSAVEPNSRPRKPAAPTRKTLPMSKEAQIRALREQGAC